MPLLTRLVVDAKSSPPSSNQPLPPAAERSQDLSQPDSSRGSPRNAPPAPPTARRAARRNMARIPTAPGVQILGPVPPEQAPVLSPAAQAYVAALHRAFNPARLALLARRDARQLAIDAGQLPEFLPDTRDVRKDPAWRGAPPAPGLVDRRVEITGPVDRKMVINALNSGATQYMADFEGAAPRDGCVCFCVCAPDAALAPCSGVAALCVPTWRPRVSLHTCVITHMCHYSTTIPHSSPPADSNAPTWFNSLDGQVGADAAFVCVFVCVGCVCCV